MFIERQNTDQVEYYDRLLSILGSLSNLFSDSETPYLGYRLTENLFCKSFGAKNLSRADVSADASKNKIGVGIKTFIEGNGQTKQKVAEFNKLRDEYANIKDDIKKVQTIAELRNKRITFTNNAHGLDELIYHCIVRSPGQIKYYDAQMPLIDIDKIQNVRRSSVNIITFTDNNEEYSFNISKSTLYKRFITPDSARLLTVEILEDPFEVLEKFLYENEDLTYDHTKDEEYVYLPLYSSLNGKVYPRSGLNAWNAQGRKRHPDEIYIPIPIEVRNNFDGFFPERDTPFNLTLPDGTVISAKVSQSNGKALTSNPNKALGKWLLRDILNLPEGTLVTNEILEEIGIDSVIVTKEKNGEYAINFTKNGSYELFIDNISDGEEDV